MLLTREELLKSGGDLPTEDVPVPELGEGCTVRIHVMTGTERGKWDGELSKCRKTDDFTTLRASLAVLSCIDESGKRLFSDKDIPTVSRFNGIALERIYDASWRLNKLGVGALEEDAKNSVSGGNESSGSSSLEPSFTNLSDGANETLTAESSPNGKPTSESSLGERNGFNQAELLQSCTT